MNKYIFDIQELSIKDFDNKKLKKKYGGKFGIIEFYNNGEKCHKIQSTMIRIARIFKKNGKIIYAINTLKNKKILDILNIKKVPSLFILLPNCNLINMNIDNYSEENIYKQFSKNYKQLSTNMDCMLYKSLENRYSQLNYIIRPREKKQLREKRKINRDSRFRNAKHNYIQNNTNNTNNKKTHIDFNMDDLYDVHKKKFDINDIL